MMALLFGTIIPAIFIGAIVLRTVTCYYFRYIFRRYAFFHPTHCTTDAYICDPEVKGFWSRAPFSWVARLFGKTLSFGDSKLFYYHKYFIWATVFLMPFHLYESIPILINAWTSGQSYLSFAVLDITLEMIYVFTGVMFIVTCHSIKYFFDRTAQRCGTCVMAHKAYEKAEHANKWHGMWLWLTLIFINIRLALLIGNGEPLVSALIMLFVRLPEHA